VRISEVMTEAAVTDRPDDSLQQAARKMWDQQTGSLLVLEGEDLVGIIT
jgi:CBS domain-containing protein